MSPLIFTHSLRTRLWRIWIFVLVPCVLLPVASLRAQSVKEENTASLWAAIEKSDPAVLRNIGKTLDPNITRTSDGHTPLTLAVQRRSFECARELIWNGAKVAMKNGKGKDARGYLQPGKPGFTSLCLLLRCHAFVQERARQAYSFVTPHRVLINDGFVDPRHPDYVDSYWSNPEEKSGRPGVDDDGNGFVDDVDGWNIMDDAPMMIPELGMGEKFDRRWLKQLMDDFETITYGRPGFDRDDRDKLKSRLEKRHENPVFRQVGFGVAGGMGLELNDFIYAKAVLEASHGTHVAGIVFSESGRRAELHALAHGSFITDQSPVIQGSGKLAEIGMEVAANSPNYTTYLANFKSAALASLLKEGVRYSDYLRSCQAGVVNMSWGRDQRPLQNAAELLEGIYRESGKDPASIENHMCPIGMDLCDELVMELQILMAAPYAILMAENPNVLFVIAAGNDGNDNDKELEIPAYLSRFFPNAITVASTDSAGNLSAFSNTGMHSVQIAGLGEKVVSSFLGGIRGRMDGTSMAAPQVAGVAAGLRSEYPGYSAPTIRRILLSSASPHSSLEGKVATEGRVDVAAVERFAANLATSKLWPAPPGYEWPSASDNTPVVKHRGPIKEEPPAAAPGVGIFHESPSGNVSCIGGFRENWRVVFSGMVSPAPAQRFIRSKEWPSAWLGEGIKQGYRITSLAGDANEWAVVTSKMPQIGDQRLVGYDFDQTALKANMDEGYRIRAVAGYGKKWVFAMDKETGLGNQRYTLPGVFDEKREQWIEKRWLEDYYITSVAGENGPEGSFSWVVVMSQGARYTDQVCHEPGPWPADWIKEKWGAGFRITAVTGYGKTWLVVMSKNSGTGSKQTYSELSKSPNDWIQERWESGW